MPRPSRVSTGTVTALTPLDTSAPSTPVREAGICVLKRESDGNYVKLWCDECQPRKCNFRNIQGFLNHYRIAHKDRPQFKTHQEAAERAGEIVQLTAEEIVNLAAVTTTSKETKKPKPKPQPQSLSAPRLHGSSSCYSNALTPSTPVAPQTPSTNMMYCHKLNKSEPMPPVNPRPLLKSDFGLPSPNHSEMGEPSSSVQAVNFVPSASTPHLNNLARKRGFEGDLDLAVKNAKQKVDLEISYPTDGEEEDVEAYSAQGLGEVNRRRSSNPDAPISRLPAPPARFGAAVTGARPGSAKGLRITSSSAGKHPSSSTLAAGGADVPESPLGMADELSPHTVESNPGLMSDHDDDDEEDDAKSVVMRDNADVDGEDVLMMDPDAADDQQYEGVRMRGSCSSRVGRKE